MLIFRLLRILTRLLLLFLQIFNLLFQLLGLFPVDKKKLLISGNGRGIGALTQSLPVNILGGGNLLQGLIDLLQCGVKLLGGKCLLRLVKDGAGLLMMKDTEILIGFRTDFPVVSGASDRLFITRQSLLRVFFLGLRLQPFVVEFHRRGIGFLLDGRRRGLLSGGSRFGTRKRRILRAEGMQSGEKKAEKKETSSRRRAHPLFRETEPEAEKQERSRERIDGPLDRTRLLAAVDLLSGELPDARFKTAEPGIGRCGPDIDSAGFLRKGAQGALVERTLHRISLRILQRAESAVFRRDLNQRRLGRIADAGDKKRNLQFDDLADSLAGIAVQLVAVGNEKNRAMGGLRRTEALDSRGKSLFNIGAADGNRIGGKIVERSQETGLVNGQRAFEKRLPGKGDQPETVTGIAFHQLADQPFGVFEPGGPHILGKHAARRVEHHHDVASLPRIGLNADAPGRTRRRNKKKNQRTGENHGAPETAVSGHGGV